jgi:hypothetical protein
VLLLPLPLLLLLPPLLLLLLLLKQPSYPQTSLVT